MNELEKKLKAEHERHGEAVVKHIDEFEEKCFGKDEKSVDEMDMKALDEFEEKMDGEHADHLEKCMKAIDDEADKIDPEEKKSIDEFRKAIEDEHLKHVKCFDKAIDEFKSALPEEDDEDQKPEVKKAIDEFETKAGDELTRHEKAHMDLCEKEFGEAQDEGKDEKAVMKAGRSISAANRQKIESVIKAIEEYHAAHTADHQQFTDKAIAALKELMGSPQGDEGKENTDEKSGAPKPRSSPSRAAINEDAPMSELEAYLFTQRLLKQVKTVVEGGLRQTKENLKEKFPSRR